MKIGAGHTEIADHHAEVALLECSQGGGAVGRRLHGVAGVAQDLAQALAYARLVVGDEDRLRHHGGCYPNRALRSKPRASTGGIASRGRLLHEAGW